MKTPIFNTKEEMFRFLKENKSLLIAEKKSTLKKADSINFSLPVEGKHENTYKSLDVLEIADISTIKVSVAINTTNIMDSHSDVHIPNIWKKSLAEQKNFILLQEHEMAFDKVISDTKNNGLTAFAKNYSWKNLGFDLEGNTQALIFEGEVSKNRNEFMFNQYAKGFVNEHSVGMQYLNLLLCMNSDSKYDIEEKANWDKYINSVVNADKAKEQGYFWAVTEAKIIEGSAVVKGSNFATPTISISTKQTEADIITSDKSEPQLALEAQREKQKQFLTNLLKK